MCVRTRHCVYYLYDIVLQISKFHSIKNALKFFSKKMYDALSFYMFLSGVLGKHEKVVYGCHIILSVKVLHCFCTLLQP